MCFKHYIRQMVAVVINTLLETFPEVYLHYPRWFRRNSVVDFLSNSFLQILKRLRSTFETKRIRLERRSQNILFLNLMMNRWNLQKKKKEKIKIQFQKIKGPYIFGQHPLVEKSPTATATYLPTSIGQGFPTFILSSPHGS